MLKGIIHLGIGDFIQLKAMKLFNFFAKKASLDNQQNLQELEDLLIRSDFGIDLADEIIKSIKQDKTQDIKQILKEKLLEILKSADCFTILSQEEINELKQQTNPKSCQVIINVGTNGVGKTTSCAKLAYYYKNLGYKVALVAADTFRSGAINQLKIWADKCEIYCFETHHKEPSAICYSAIENLAKDFELIIIDSAGRSPHESNLMSQLSKMERIVTNSKLPHKTLLTLDGTNGSQAKEQARIFSEHLTLNGLIITKLDGSAKAGMIFDIVKHYHYPIAYIGLGEKMDDLQKFDAREFIKNIVGS